MGMEIHNCCVFELEMRVPSALFNKDAFWSDIKDNSPQDQEVCGWSFGSKTNPGKEHAHIVVDFRSKKRIRISISYHRTNSEVEDVRPPYMEDCASWLGSFIAKEELEARLIVSYLFEEGYASVVSLPFPLLTVAPGREFEGASVTGIAIRLPDVQRVTIDTQDRKIFLGLRVSKEVNLNTFQLDQSLDGFSPLVNKLVYETTSL